MVDYYWEHHSTYRGIEIVVLMPGSLAYGAMLGGYLRTKTELSDIRAQIDEYLGPEPEPGKVFIETYRGVDIYYDDAVHRYWFEFESVPYGPATLNEAHTWIDTLLEPEPEPEEYWAYHSTYREILIYIWMPSEAYYQATFGGEIHNTTSLSTLQAEIDAFLGPEPEWQLIEIYRGLAIWFWPGTADPEYGYWTVKEGMQYGPYSTIQECRDKIDELVEPPVNIPTTTTISAPSQAAVNENFFISGILYESEAGIPIPNQPINHSYNGRSLGSSTTGVDGNYLKEVSIPESGTWSLKSEFPGAEALQTSRALVDAVVGAPPIETALLIAGPIVTGLALVIYGSR